MDPKTAAAFERIRDLCDEHLRVFHATPNPTVVEIKRIVSMALKDVPTTKEPTP